MSDNHQPPSLTLMDKAKEYIGIVLHPDGSITRSPPPPGVPAAADPGSPSPVLTKDLSLNEQNQTWVRLFLPRQASDHNSSTSTKLPLVVYFHGGGFVVGNTDSIGFHNFCADMAVRFNAFIVSVEYRLAPEHRLPAAYDDAVEALHWIKSAFRNDAENKSTNWLNDFADFNNCFLMGSSAGANMVYHAGLRAAVDDLEPLKIKGLILHHAYFGGSQRTGSEERLVNNKRLPLFLTDLMWELSLPIGVDRDHEYCNPTAASGLRGCERFKMLGWSVIVTGCDGDPLIDRQIEFAEVLESKGVDVISEFSEGGCHGVEFFEQSKAVELFEVLKIFISNRINA